MSTIMITGGSGFLGTYVARVLAERGDRVVIFDAAGPAPELAALHRLLHGLAAIALQLDHATTLVALNHARATAGS